MGPVFLSGAPHPRLDLSAPGKAGQISFQRGAGAVRSRDVTGMHDPVATAALGAVERGVGGFDEIECEAKSEPGSHDALPTEIVTLIGFSPPYSMDAASTRARSRSATTLAPTLGVSGKRMTNSSPP